MPTPNIRPNNSNEGKLGTEAHFWAEVNAATIKEAGVRVATLASPDLTGTPTAPKPADADNTTKIATTSWVRTLITGIWLKLTGSPTTNNLLKYDGSGIMSDSGQSTTTLLARANHTGAQAQSTITDLVTDQATQTTAIATNATAIAANLASITSINLSDTEFKYDPAIVNLTATGATALDGIVTTSVVVGRVQTVVLTDGTIHFYKLVSSTAAESSPTYIRPDDYAASSNEKVWFLVDIKGADITATGTVTGATVTATGAVAGASVTATGTVAGALLDATAATIDNVTVSSALFLTGVQTVAAGGTTTALDLTKSVHHIDADGGGDIFTLADGVVGQIKTICMDTATGLATITPTNLAGGTSVTFNAAGETVILQFVDTQWYIIGGNAYTVV